MRIEKTINGRLVEISDIRIFEEGFKGMMSTYKASSGESDRLSINNKVNEGINRVIDEYYNIIKEMPFPMYSIENNLKYYIIGSILKQRITGIVAKAEHNSLYIGIGDTTIQFISDTWGIVSESIKEDIKPISYYKNEVGYKEFCWLYERIRNKKGTKGFYKQFMGDIIDACNGNVMVFKWELERMLEYGVMYSDTSRVQMSNHIIIDTNENKRYRMNINIAGKKKIELGKSTEIDMVRGTVSTISKVINIYDYETVLEEDAHKNVTFNGEEEMFKSVVLGILSNHTMINNIEYCGIIVYNTLIYKVENEVSIYDSGVVVEVLNNASIEAVEYNRVYLKVVSQESNYLSRIDTYCYNVDQHKLKLHKTEFKNECL